ncbi:MAG: YbgA family protein [Clostridium sp.]
MNNWIKPKIIISKCLNNTPCRYNGESCNNKIVTKLSPFIDFIDICPEQEIGLSTPRNPIRLVQKNKKTLLIDTKTFKDYTSLMTEFSNDHYNILQDVRPQGFILKAKSPSCAIHDANVYADSLKGSPVLSKSSGLYGAFIKSKFYNIPIEDDGRLSNFVIRDRFLTKIFTLSYFYSLKNKNDLNLLLLFHKKNTLLFISYNKNLANYMKDILNDSTTDFKNIFLLYESALLDLFATPPEPTSMIDAFLYAYIHFSDMLRTDEKNYFFELIEKYNSGECPHSVIIHTLKGYAIRFYNDYILEQSLLKPYPEELMDFSDSGKGIVRK